MTNDPKAAYEAIVADLTDGTHVTASKMFSMPCLKIGGKAFAGLYRDAMVFKLNQDALTEALTLPGAHLFDPSGRGHPWNEWVVVPAESASRWPELAHAALGFVASDL